MDQVHWWLAALAFGLGMVLTLVLMVQPANEQVPVGTSRTRTGGSGAQPHRPTAKKPAPAHKATAPRTNKKAVTKDSPPKKAPARNQLSTTTIADAKESARERISVAKASPTMQARTLPFAPYGRGSARAGPDGGGPAGWLVKGRSDTRLYYTPDDPAYDSIVAQVWFRDEAAAARAFFTPWAKSARRK
ncbi:hypothetical protein H7H78_03040 [Mycobacterium shinjukuense]|uniref:Putative membrane protein ArfC n=1 Tax=Mycobacterium shinjukuense TaxID=398694 RepID=A0A7I7MK30_9MYCO|nr:hypothetical protein [Mycobacterium shinjukuense]MCV6984458.1 hypothetical protein [Mycobacterium shinjukuense]ORB65808.1 hypothetical protein BST45_14745 [Mycobacterium shinjukuense]BBX72157.1 putative membrane protein ArfC [Mycobacterium shinjukuense]